MVTRLSGGNTPADPADPRTFPTIWNAAADEIEAKPDVPAGTAGDLVTVDGAGGLSTVDSGAYAPGYALHPTARWPGLWFTGPGRRVTSAALLPSRLHPMLAVFDRALTIDRVSINVTTAVAACLLRIGAYNDSDGAPGTLIADFGTVDASTTGSKEITVSQALPFGPVWFVVAVQGGASNPAVTGIMPDRGPNGSATSAGLATAESRGTSAASYGAGGLPDPAPTFVTTWAQAFPMIGYRVVV